MWRPELRAYTYVDLRVCLDIDICNDISCTFARCALDKVECHGISRGARNIYYYTNLVVKIIEASVMRER